MDGGISSVNGGEGDGEIERETGGTRVGSLDAATPGLAAKKNWAGRTKGMGTCPPFPDCFSVTERTYVLSPILAKVEELAVESESREKG